MHSRTRTGCGDEAQQSRGACVHCGRPSPSVCAVARHGHSRTDARAHDMCMRACPQQNAHAASRTPWDLIPARGTHKEAMPDMRHAAWHGARSGRQGAVLARRARLCGSSSARWKSNAAAATASVSGAITQKKNSAAKQRTTTTGTMPYQEGGPPRGVWCHGAMMTL